METAPAPTAPTVARTNSVVETETWDVEFYEAREPSPPGNGEGLWGYEGRSIKDDPTYSGEKWLYVAQANLDADDRITRTSLKVEGQYDADGALTLVDWALPGDHPQGAPHPLAGRDTREPTVPREDGRVRLTFRVDGLAPGGASNVGPPPGGRSVYLAFLSHVQLPATRLDLYFGERADQSLLDRALLLDPSALRADGTKGGETVGYGPSAADALRRAGVNWVTAARGEGATPLAQAVLVDHVALADEIHQKYEEVLEPLLVYDLKNASKAFHATVTRSIAEAYAAAETGGDLDEVPGRPLVKIREFEAERAALVEPVELWAQKLYWDHMRQPGYRLARADAADAEDATAPTEEQYLRIEDEAERQLQLLDGAELSDAGKRYLVDEVGDVGRGGWFVWFAKLESFLAKVAAVPVVDLKRAFKDPWARSRKIVGRTLPELNERRIGLVGDLARVTEHARTHRAQTTAAAAQLRRVQNAMNGALAKVQTEAQLLQSLRSERAQLRESRALSRRRFERLLRAGQADFAPGVRMRTASEMAGDGAVHFFDPRSLSPGPQSSLGSRVRTFRFRGDDYVRRPSGLLVLADGDRLLVGAAGPAALGDEVRATARWSGALDEAIADVGRRIGQAERAADAARQRHGGLSDEEVRARAIVGELERQTGAHEAAVDQAQKDVDVVDGQIQRHQADVDDLVRQADAGIERTVTSPKSKLAFGLGALGAGIAAADFVHKMADGEPDAWGIYDDAFVSAVGAVGGVAGTVDALETISRRVALGVRSGTAARVLVKGLGAVGGACAVWVGVVEFRRATENRDTVAQWSAGFAITSGAFAVIAGVGAATSWTGPGAVAAMGLAALITGLVSIGLWLFTDTPLETWFKKHRWRAGAPPIGADTPALRERMGRDLTDLLRLLAMPVVSVELWNGGGLAAFGTGAGRQGPPAFLRFVVRPGFRTPGMAYVVSDLRLRVARSGPDLDWRLQRPGTSFNVPDSIRSLYTPADGESRAAYLHDLPIDYDLVPDAVAEALGRRPDHIEFLCAVSLGTAGGDGPDVSFRLRGDVGYTHVTDASGWHYSPMTPLSPAAGDGPRVSVGLPEPD